MSQSSTMNAKTHNISSPFGRASCASDKHGSKTYNHIISKYAELTNRNFGAFGRSLCPLFSQKVCVYCSSICASDLFHALYLLWFSSKLGTGLLLDSMLTASFAWIHTFDCITLIMVELASFITTWMYCHRFSVRHSFQGPHCACTWSRDLLLSQLYIYLFGKMYH